MCIGLPVKVNGKLIFARTMEFSANMDSVMRFTPKNTEFVAVIEVDEKNNSRTLGKKWKSNYAIMGPTTMGTEYLVEGINEKGLYVGGFYFYDYAKYQTRIEASNYDDYIGPLNFVDFLLGTCESVEDVQKALETTKVCDVYFSKLGKIPPVHWIVQQSDGKAKVVEYLDGKLHILDNPLNVFSNSPDFSWHMTNLRNYVNLSFNNAEPLELTGCIVNSLGQGSGMLGLPGDFTPPSRFIRAVALSQSVALPGASSTVNTLKEGVNLAWNLIDNVNIPIGAVRDKQEHDAEDDYTQWVTVSDLDSLRIYFRTYDNQNIRFVDMNQLLNTTEAVDIPMKQPVEYQDVTTPLLL